MPAILAYGSILIVAATIPGVAPGRWLILCADHTIVVWIGAVRLPGIDVLRHPACSAGPH